MVKGQPEMENFQFEYSTFKDFTNNENFALRSLCLLIARTPANRDNALLATDYGQNTTLMSYVIKTESEDISYHLTNTIFDATSDFYIEKSIEKHQSTLSVLLSKRDSALRELDKLEYRFADLSDRSSGLFSKKTEVRRERARTEMLQMSAGIAKLEENIALTEFAIENSTPILQVIDAPILPLKEIRMGSLKSVFLGFFGGLVLGGILILLFRFYSLTVET